MLTHQKDSTLVAEKLLDRGQAAPGAVAAAPEEWVVGLSMREAEELLDQMERRGEPILAVRFEEATGFAVRTR
jgi:hypothetical protein